MAEEKRIPIFGANWKAGKEKTNITSRFIKEYFSISAWRGEPFHVALQTVGKNVEVFIAPSFTSISDIIQKTGILKKPGIKINIAAQDIYFEDNGPYTSTVTGPMLKDKAVKYVIVGHSERRYEFGDTNEDVAKKAVAVHRNNMLPIICVGENLHERENGKLYDIVEEQICSVFNELRLRGHPTVDNVIAYEPLWAIGIGETATPQQAQEMHQYIKEILATKFNKNVADSARIMYGGSVTPSNIADLMAQQDIDGALVGGASLNPRYFFEIVKGGTEAYYSK